MTDRLFRISALAFPALIVLAAVMQDTVDPRLLFLDPMVAVEVAGQCCKTYYGIISTIGVMMWLMTATLCLFAAFVLYQLGAASAVVRFALVAGLFTGWLGLDDAFLFHENIAPKLGIPQLAILLVYGGLAAAYTILCVRQILASDVLLFVLAGGFLASSLAIDAFLHSTDSFVTVLEDGAKFFGIACWVAFHVSAMAKAITRQIDGDTLRTPAAADPPVVLHESHAR